MITVKQSGSFNKTFKFLNTKPNVTSILKKYGSEGVKALQASTPYNTGATANAWEYHIDESSPGYSKIYWTNSNIVSGASIALILQYGHGTRNGGYVQGRDYINPAIQPVFDKFANAAWKEVTKI